MSLFLVLAVNSDWYNFTEFHLLTEATYSYAFLIQATGRVGNSGLYYNCPGIEEYQLCKYWSMIRCPGAFVVKPQSSWSPCAYIVLVRQLVSAV